MIIYLLSFIFRTLLWEKLRVLEFGYANPPDWSSPVIIIAWFLEFLILFLLFRRYRIKKRASWGKVIVILVFTDLLYLAVGAIFLYLVVAVSLWLGYPDGL